jgi:hypothetical protein
MAIIFSEVDYLFAYFIKLVLFLLFILGIFNKDLHLLVLILWWIVEEFLMHL